MNDMDALDRGDTIDVIITTNENLISRCENPIISLCPGYHTDNERKKWMERQEVIYDLTKIESYLLDCKTQDFWENFVGILAEELNGVHKEKFSCRYWTQILYGYRALIWIRQIFYCQMIFSRLLQKYSDRKLICHVLPMLGEVSFDWNIDENEMLLIVYTMIIRECKAENVSVVDMHSNEREMKKYGVATTVSKLSIRSRLLYCWKNNSLKEIWEKTLRRIYGKIVLQSNEKIRIALYAPPMEERIVATLRKKYRQELYLFPSVTYREKEKTFIQAIDRENTARKVSSRMGSNGTLLDRQCAYIFIKNIPRSALEEYSCVKKSVAKHEKPNLKIIVSATGWGHLFFRFWVARQVELYNSRLVGGQHGGGEAWQEQLHLFVERLFFLDYYYTWGWAGKTGGNCEFIRGSGWWRSQRYADLQRKKSYILFVGTSIGRSGNLWDSVPPTSYIEGKMDFFKLVYPRCKDVLLCREFMVDEGWNIKGELRERFPELRFDDEAFYDARGTNFPERLMASKICICDCCSTVFFESLYMNIPCIMFFNEPPNHLVIPKEHQTLLEKNGLLFFSAVNAAKYLLDICGDIEQWWNDPQRQLAVQEIQQYYISSIKPTDTWWTNIFDSIMEED